VQPLGIVNDKALAELGWATLCKDLASRARTPMGRERCLALLPGDDPARAKIHLAKMGETRELTLRAESFNVFNHAQFFGPEAVNGNPDSANFGRIVNANAPRQLQLAAKFRF